MTWRTLMTALIAGAADRAEQLLAVVETVASQCNLQLNWVKSVLLKSQASQNSVYNMHGDQVKEVTHAKYLGVHLSRNGTTRKHVTERLRKARKHFNTLHHFWRHTGLPPQWKLRIYNAAFVPMIVYGMESAALTQLDAFHSQSLRKIHRERATLYTKVLAPEQTTTTNQELREQSSQPPLTHHIHKAQLKLFGHVLNAPENCLERDCCLTKSFLYGGGVVGSGIRRGRPRIHLAEQCAIQAWHLLQNLPNPPTQKHPKFPFVLFSFTTSSGPATLRFPSGCTKKIFLPSCRRRAVVRRTRHNS